MDRITNTDKWKDDWFLSLSPNAKLLFFYLFENCDVAGFYKLNSRFMQKQTNIVAKDIVAALNELKKGLVFNNSIDPTNKKVWIKNFLFYQQQLPLEKNNVEHKKIALIIEKNLSEFDSNQDMLYILDKVQTTTNKKNITRFVAPSLVEFILFGTTVAQEKNIPVDNAWFEQLYNYYASIGWKVGKSQKIMKDWKAAIRGALAREQQKVSNKPVGKIQKLRNANEDFTNVTTQR